MAATCLRLISPSSGSNAIRVEREDWTNTRHRGQEPITFGQGGIGGDHLGEPLVEQCDVQRDTGNTAAVQTPEAHIFEQPRRILGSDLLVTELPPRRHDLRDPLGCLVTLSGARRHGGDEQRDHASVEPIVLGQNPTRLCKLAKLKRIDLPRHSGRTNRKASRASNNALTDVPNISWSSARRSVS